MTGRYLFASPIPGDYDIVGVLCGCAIFAFLPYCQLKRGNVLVDFFTQSATPQAKSVLDATGSFLFLAAAIMFTWRLWHGLLEMRESGEQIYAFEFYRWWTIPFDIFCMVDLDPHHPVHAGTGHCRGQGRSIRGQGDRRVSDLAIGGVGFGALFVLIALRVPIGVAMIVVGMIGYVSIAGTVPLLSFLKTEMYWRFSSFDFSVIPLFLMMGSFANRAGVTTALFRAASAFIGHLRGGLAMAAIGGCATFGAISGSSLATAAMMGQVALPQLRRYKYSGAFATGDAGCRRHARRADPAVDPADHLRHHGRSQHRRSCSRPRSFPASLRQSAT